MTGVWSEKRALALLLLAVFLLHLPALFMYTGYVHDEVYFAEFGKNLAYGNGSVFDVHPYLQKDVTAASILLFGNNPVGWRLPNMLVHLALIAAVFLLAKELFPKGVHQGAAPLMAAVLMAAETMTFTLGSFAMVDGWAPLFLTLTFLYILRFLSSKSRNNLLVAALAAGAALASKWPAAIVVVVLCAYVVWEGRLFQRKSLLAMFVIVSLAVYAASFIPYAARGNDPLLWHTQALNYHLTLNATHPYFSHPATWPFGLRPVWFEFTSTDSLVKGVFAVGNIVLLWPMVPAAAYVAIRKRKNRPLFTLAAAFLLFWLAFFPLRATSMYNLAPVVPVGILLITSFMASLQNKWLKVAYIAAAAGFFLFFYPLLVGLPIPEWFYRWHIWLPWWI